MWLSFSTNRLLGWESSEAIGAWYYSSRSERTYQAQYDRFSLKCSLLQRGRTMPALLSLGRGVEVGIYLVCMVPCTIAFWARRDRFPLSKRRPELVILFLIAFTIDFATTATTMPCFFSFLLRTPGIPLAFFALSARAWVLTMSNESEAQLRPGASFGFAVSSRA